MSEIPWLESDACINRIVDGVYAAKTPIEGHDTWSFDHMMAQVPANALVLNLTNTTKYYIPRPNVTHVRVRGHTLPPVYIVKKCVDFIDNAVKAGTPVIVHCTHGLNRTGYMVCAYMVHKLQYSLEHALDTFAQKRPPGVQHIYYKKYLPRSL